MRKSHLVASKKKLIVKTKKKIMPTAKSRPKCSKKDEIVYFTFWPILAFSFFIAVDQILEDDGYEQNDTHAVVMASVNVCKTFVHMFAIACLIISLTEVYIAFEYLSDPLCSRLIYLEVDAAIAAVFLLVLTFLDTFNGYVQVTTTLSDMGFFLTQFIPWLITMGILLYQLVAINTHQRKTRFNLK